MATPVASRRVRIGCSLLFLASLTSCISRAAEETDPAGASVDTIYVSFETVEDIEAFYEEVKTTVPRPGPMA